MIKTKLIGFLFFILCAFTPQEFVPVHSIPFSSVKFFTTDNLGNAFVISGNQLLEFDTVGKPLFNFSENNLGELRSVDPSNPMKILLFYPDFGDVILLNNKLSVQSVIHLRSLGIMQPTVCCSSSEDGYWVYDLQDFQLKKIDLNLQVVYQSGNLVQVMGVSIRPNFLIEDNSMIYLNDPGNGIFVFDRYGTYYKTIPIKGLNQFQVLNNELLYVKNDTLNAYHLKTIEERTIILPEHQGMISARFCSQKLYLLTDRSLSFYSI